MDEEWCFEKLKNLKIKENRLMTLTEIRGKLNESSSLEAIITNRLLSAPELYDCVEEENENLEQIDIASDILSICMANLTISQSSDLPQLLHRSLTHQCSRIRALALNVILKEIKSEPSQETNVSDDLLKHVLDCAQQHETEVGFPAISILSIILENNLNRPMVKSALQQMLSQNETIKCRAYELAVNLSKRSPELLSMMEYILDKALSELDNDDILLQVNILEILVNLAEQNYGLLYLEKRQVFEVFNQRVELLEQKPLDRLLIPGIMKFFGKIAVTQPTKIITGYPHMIHCLFECIHSGDTTILPVAFDTLANLALSNEGKLLLEKHYFPRLVQTFQDFATHLQNLSSELKNRCFNALEIIFTANRPINEEISNILHNWFVHIALGPNMQFLLDFCRNPFPDIKISCLNFIRAVCQHNWGIIALKNTGGFVEYLLDRKVEFDKDSKYAKYEIIKLLAESNEFNQETTRQLQTFINEGPYFVESIMDIAVEGN